MIQIKSELEFDLAWTAYQAGDSRLLLDGLFDIPFEKYLAIRAISAHGIMDILRSPAHFYCKSILGIRKTTEANEFGRLLHKAVLEPKQFKARYIVEPKFVGKTKDGRDSAQSAEARKKKEEWHAALHPSRILVTQEEADEIIEMIAALNHHKVAWNLISRGHSEVSGFWITENGTLCKFRPDKAHLSEHVLADYKTTTCAENLKFAHDAAKFQYDVQAYWYRWMYFKKFGVWPAFVFIPQEKEPPFAVNVFPASDAFLEVGKHYVEKGLALYEECMEREWKLIEALGENEEGKKINWRDAWPSYGSVAQDLHPPHWRTMQVQDEYAG